MGKKGDLRIKREVWPYQYLHMASNYMLEITSTLSEGQYYTIMSSLLFSAFTFEAFLNHLGSKKISFWNKIESIKVMDKYEVLANQFGIKLDSGRRPYQTLNDLFKFRNELAHGKSKTLTYSAQVDIDENNTNLDNFRHFQPQEHWEKYCTQDNAKKAISDIDKIMKELSEASGEVGFPFFFQGSSIGITY